MSIEPTLTFYLEIDPENPHIGHFSADTSELGEFNLLQPRRKDRLSRDSLTVQCTNHDDWVEVIYNAAIECDRLNWTVEFLPANNFDLDVSEQNNFYSDEKWWVLFEWGAIPRIDTIETIHICGNIHQENNPQLCRKLPEINNPPLIFMLGKAAAEFREEHTSFRIFTDSPGKTLVGEAEKKILISQYHYLADLFFDEDVSDKYAELAWAGIEKKHGVLGGAAGVTGFVSNYTLENGAIDADNKERLFWISGHEIFHILAPYRYDLWVSESLAHYYGYKSLIQDSQISYTPVDNWNENKNRMPNSTAGLYQAHLEVTRNSNMSYYGLFYEKGAAFWYEVDSLLMTNGESLDKYLRLISESNSRDGILNSDFIESMSRIIGQEEFERLLQQYLY